MIHMAIMGDFDKKEAVKRLIEESAPTYDYFFLLIASTLITTMGLILDVGSIVIGGMLISPLLTPLLALGLGIITNNHGSIRRSVLSILISMLIVLVVSFLTAFFLGVREPISFEILQRAQVSLPYLYIAILSGVAATYAWIRPKINASLPGVAVAIALLPPLCVSGIGLSILDKIIFSGSFQLFVINFLGIVGSAVVVFSLSGFHDMKQTESLELKEEEVKNKRSKEQVQHVVQNANGNKSVIDQAQQPLQQPQPPKQSVQQAVNQHEQPVASQQTQEQPQQTQSQ